MTSTQHDLDASAAWALPAITVAASAALLLAHEAIDRQWAWFLDASLRTLWYTAAIAPPLLLCLLLRRARDAYAWLCAGVAWAVLLPLAWRSGSSCDLNGPVTCAPLMPVYVLCIALVVFLVSVYLQTWRDARRWPYALLYTHAWDHALTLAAAAFFTGCAWLILLLWSSLFHVIGMDFFRDLFEQRRFIYPVTGLFVGFGIVLTRQHRSALQGVLRVCLSIARGLLPLIGALAIAFLAGLCLSGVQPLWNTRHAGALLLTLVLVTVALANGLFQDGQAPAPGASLRRLMQATLLCLPAYAVLAAIALSLRVQQHGWSADRLWAAFVCVFALLYAVSYALAALSRPFTKIAPANTLIGALLAAALLATQSGLLDFQRISVQSQLARVERGELPLEKLDLQYLRWELGRTGYDALVALKDDARATNPASWRATVEQVLRSQNRWEREANTDAETLRQRFIVVPAGTDVPEELYAMLAQEAARSNSECATEPSAECVLIGVDLRGDAALEWILLRRDRSACYARWPVFGMQAGAWKPLGLLRAESQMACDDAEAARRLEALMQGRFRPAPSQWKDLLADDVRYLVEENF